jgi:hypothetical protein
MGNKLRKDISINCNYPTRVMKSLQIQWLPVMSKTVKSDTQQVQHHRFIHYCSWEQGENQPWPPSTISTAMAKHCV